MAVEGFSECHHFVRPFYHLHTVDHGGNRASFRALQMPRFQAGAAGEYFSASLDIGV